VTPPLLDAMARLRHLRWEACVTALRRASMAHEEALREARAIEARRNDILEDAERRSQALASDRSRGGGALALYAHDLAASKRRIAALADPLAAARQTVIHRARVLEDARSARRLAENSKRRWSLLVDACRERETARRERREELEDGPGLAPGRADR
jgi:hypothetical protein